MARLRGLINVDPVVVGGGGPTWLAQGIAAPHQRVLITSLYVGTDYGTNGTPGLLSVYRATSAGSGGTPVTPIAIDQGVTESFQSSWSEFLSVAPSGLTLLRCEYVNPQVSVPELLERPIIIRGGGILAVAFTPGVSSDVKLMMGIEE
jgi:hypothetical protein